MFGVLQVSDPQCIAVSSDCTIGKDFIPCEDNDGILLEEERII